MFTVSSNWTRKKSDIKKSFPNFKKNDTNFSLKCYKINNFSSIRVIQRTAKKDYIIKNHIWAKNETQNDNVYVIYTDTYVKRCYRKCSFTLIYVKCSINTFLVRLSSINYSKFTLQLCWNYFDIKIPKIINPSFTLQWLYTKCCDFFVYKP